MMNSLKKVVKKFRPEVTTSLIKKRLPILEWLPQYTLKRLQSDLLAGLAVGLMIIPQSLAHATIAGLKPQYGLYSSFAAMFVYLFLGTSKDVSIGTTVITALLTSRYSVTDDTNPQIASVLAFLVGVVLLTVALCRLGFVVRFLSYPVISGFVSASAIIISSSQLRYLFGLSKPPRMIILKLKHFFENLKHTRAADTSMGLICLVLLFLFQHLSTRDWKLGPEASKLKKISVQIARVVGIGRNAVIAVVAIIVSYLFYVNGMDGTFITVGQLPAGLPKFEMPIHPVQISANTTVSIKEMISGFKSGLGILPLIILIQSIAASKALARKNKYKIDPFQEILALGVGNVFSSFFGSFPLTASFSRSAINSMSGATSPLAGVFTSVIVIMAIEFVSPLFRFVPMSSLAAIVIAAVVSLFDHKLARQLWRVNKMDFLVWLVSFFGCLYEIEIGILAGVMISVAVILYRDFNPRLNVSTDMEERRLTIALKGGVWFPGIEGVASKVSSLLGDKPGSFDVVLFDCKAMYDIDYTVVHGLKEIEADCRLVNVTIEFTNVEGEQIKNHLEEAGLLKTQTVAVDEDKTTLVLNGDANEICVDSAV